MKGTMDFTNCKSSITEIFFNNLVVPIETGNYEHDYDVIMTECSPQFISRLCLKRRRYLRKKIKSGIKMETELMPLGVNLRDIPENATVTFTD